ncbi:MAG TPA: EAL domain-containing protein [Solirubrobacteraceae bacterium]|nr:EAL domain-containing protein [Solirubrobacteraceae bacterium]
MSVQRRPSGGVLSGPPPGSDPARADAAGLLAQVPAILYIADAGADGRWHYVSPQIETILGFTPVQWCAQPRRWAEQLHPDDFDRVIAEEVAAAADEHEETSAAEYRLRHRDGRVVWIRDDAQLLIADDGSRRWHGVLSDITERKRAETELELRAAQQAAVATLGEHALEGASTSELCQEAIEAGMRLLGVEIGAVIELLPEGDAFCVRAARGLRDVVTQTPVPAGSFSQAGYTILHGAPVTVADWDVEDRFERSAALTAQGPLSGLTVAVQGRRAPFGVLGLHSLVRREFTSSDVAFAQALANVLGDAFEHQVTEDDIRHRALHDPLTGLPNRVLFMDRLQQAIERLRRRDTPAAVLFLDMDRFKLVNDSLGHEVGDELLAAAAPRLKQALRSSDTVARLGADEFAILLEEIADENDAVEMAQRVAGMFTRPFVLAGTEHFVTTSIGIALAAGGERPEDLIRDADAAMHRAKERGRARYELFDEGIRGRAISRLRVENDLRRALERDELTLHYQPQVSLGDRSIVGVEALVRWEHPTRGRIAPADFIPVAEENGLIDPIGRWVLDRACRQAAHWYRTRPDSAPISMSVNLSAVQFRNRNLTETVADALRGANLDPVCLSLELTESVMVGYADSLMETLEALKALGVRLVLDDFGTGYSSLAYLTRLPLDALKVDRSFIDGLGTEPRDTAVTEAIIAMAHALSLQVVGEGTETELQVTELTRLGCDIAQGYHFSRPLPAGKITRMLHRGPAWLTPGV